MIKKTIAVLLSVILILCIQPMMFSASAEESGDTDNPGIRIDRTYLCVGEPLSVSNPEGFALRYFVEDTPVSGDTLELTPEYYEKRISVKAYDGDELVCEDSVYFSRLPVIYISTDDKSDITSKTEYKSGDMFIQNNCAVSQPVYSGKISIKGRGNSTWLMPKKPYRIKLDKKTDLYGMGKNKNWVLLANYHDESLLRNTTAAQIAQELGIENMQSVWTDVVLNGEYIGNYQLCENIRIDEDRVDIFDWEEEAKSVASAVSKEEKKKGNNIDKDALEDYLKENLSWITSGFFEFGGVTFTVGDYYDAEDDISGGYLFELSEEYDEISEFKTDHGLMVMLKSPEYLSTNPEMMSYVRQYWQCLENAYRSEDGYTDTPEGRKHYSQLADIDTMAAYWLVMEITDNVDSMFRSRYAYKDIGGLIKFGPAWDFDHSLGAQTTDLVATGWRIPAYPGCQNFFIEFLDDPVFLTKAVEKYWEIRPFLERLIESGGILDSEFDYLKESGIADSARWNRSDVYPIISKGFENDASVVMTFLRKRISWLDEQFASETKLLDGTFNPLSASPYVKANNMLAMSITNASKDLSEHAPADGAVPAGAGAAVSVDVLDPLTDSLSVYVNGLYHSSVAVSNKKASFVIDSEQLYEEEHKKNVICVIGKTDSGITTFRNFATVIQNGAERLLGDADGNGSVNVGDATYIQMAIANIAIGGQRIDYNDMDKNDLSFLAADVDGNGIVNIGDATIIQMYVAHMPVFDDIGKPIV